MRMNRIEYLGKQMICLAIHRATRIGFNIASIRMPQGLDAMMKQSMTAAQVDAELATEGRVRRAVLREGIDILASQGESSQSTTNVRQDCERVQFCYALRGCSHYRLTHGKRQREYELKAGMHCISYSPGCHCRATHSGNMESVTIAMPPDLLRELVPEMDNDLIRQLDSARCCALGRSDVQTNLIAYTLSAALCAPPTLPAAALPSPLWLLGQSMVLVSLALAAHASDACRDQSLSASDRKKLLQARDLLLADLSQAPTIAMLARQSGVGILKLKRGFRTLFQHSIYGLFQHERMHEARRRLSHGDSSVMMVASDMGYVNASHFAAAFQKQFGIKPSALKQRR